jgi:hypothetical protein
VNLVILPVVVQFYHDVIGFEVPMHDPTEV